MRPLLLPRSPAFAIAWEIWGRNRTGMRALAILLAATSAINWTLLRNRPAAAVAVTAEYVLLAGFLFAVFGFFHFTEGRPKGGFGSFPPRLFHLPVGTLWLAALPMAYGAAAVVTVYLAAAWLMFRPLGETLPVLWPCLYLVSGLALFQTVVWSIPERRYLKILSLSVVATLVCFGWMFFLPHIIEGTLSELGYTGDPRRFEGALMLMLVATGPAACAVSAWRLGRQRHGGVRRSRCFGAPGEWAANRLFRRKRPFRSARHAAFATEWRRTGFILPTAVGAILAMICLPAALGGHLSSDATLTVLLWLLAAPILCSVVIGCGFSRFDFWSADLRMTPFAAVRPFSPGEWVVVRLLVALASAVVTWLAVLLGAFLWLAHAGDWGAWEQLHRQFLQHYGPRERWPLLGVALGTIVLLTWRFLIAGLPIGFAGHRGWFYGWNASCAAILASLLFMRLWRSDYANPLHLDNLWPWVIRLPWILAVVIIAKVSLAAWAWRRVLDARLFSRRGILGYFSAWTMACGSLAGGVSIACAETAWLRSTLILLSWLVVPLAGPAWAMLALRRNRSRS